MSRIRANQITNQSADGAPTVQNGLIISGVTTVTTLDLNGDLDVDGHLNADNVSIAGVVTATSFVGSGANLTSLPAQATIANNADNRVITGGSGVNLNGESGLTFSSDRLILTNTSTPQIRINNDTSDGSGTRFVFGKATANNNFFNGAVAGDSCIGFPSTLLFGVGASEKLRIDSNGHLLHGVTADEDTSGSGGLRFINTGDI